MYFCSKLRCPGNVPRMSPSKRHFETSIRHLLDVSPRTWNYKIANSLLFQAHIWWNKIESNKMKMRLCEKFKIDVLETSEEPHSADVFLPPFQVAHRTFPERMFQRTQTSLRHPQIILKRLPYFTTKPDVAKTSGKGRLTQDVWRTSDLRRLEDVQFTTSWRRLIYNVLKTSDFWRLEVVWFASPWRHPIYDISKTSVKQLFV